MAPTVPSSTTSPSDGSPSTPRAPRLMVQVPSQPDVTRLQPSSAAPSSRSTMRHSPRTRTLPKHASDAAKQRVKEVTQKLDALDGYYRVFRRQILRYQSYTTGLYPQLSTPDCEIGHVRDSIYCAMTCWTLSCGYKRLDDDRGRTHELQQTAVKTMRGILLCWMMQADKLEAFKHNPCPDNALHSRFHLLSGKEVSFDKSSFSQHLQIDCVALYLLSLAQMTEGSIRIIFSRDEVSFVQNLVFYIERAYRTPDFGIWETGTRYNNGQCELHASSLGMVKSALEATNGCNLYGAHSAAPGSVLYVDVDAHNRNRTTFESLIPRESASKNTDAALLATVSWPCFATHNLGFVDKVFDKCIRRLGGGTHGFKRFLRDGFGCALYNPSRQFYDQGETKMFAGIEPEWPMFYLYLILDGICRNKPEQTMKYQALLEPLLISTQEYGTVVPRFYYVPEECMMAERLEPGSQRRVPSFEVGAGGESECIMLWAQSLYITAGLLSDGLVLVSDIDPLNRRMRACERQQKNAAHSAFQGDCDPVVQVALISESMRLQTILSTYGIQSQTPHQVQPIQIWPSAELVKVFSNLGVNEKLKLSGRPTRPLGSLSTSKVYRVYGETVICYPLSFELNDFYMAADPSMIIDDIKQTLVFVADRWKMVGRPTVVVLLREQNTTGERFSQMLELLTSFKRGNCDGVRVRVGRLQNLLVAACTEYLDFAPESLRDSADFQPLTEITSNADYKLFRSMHNVADEVCPLTTDHRFDVESLRNMETGALVDTLKAAQVSALHTQAHVLDILRERHGWNYMIDDMDVRQRMDHVCRQAGIAKLWHVVRFAAGLLRKVVDSLAPSITSLLVMGKFLTIGLFGVDGEVVIDKPVNPSEIEDAIFTSCASDPRAASLAQELILALGYYVETDASLFNGMLKIRIGWLIHALDLYTEYDVASKWPVSVYSLSPKQVRESLHNLLAMKRWDDMTPLQKRQLNGSVNRVPVGFYDDVWEILEKTPGGIEVSGKFLPQQPTLSEMTEYELNFALTVEHLLSRIRVPEYRQVMVELFIVVWTILKRNPELRFEGKLDFDALIKDGFKMFAQDRNLSTDDMTPFYQLRARARAGTAAYLAKAVVDTVLRGEDDSDYSTSKAHDWHCCVM